MTLHLATRGSQLALWQAHTTRDLLAERCDASAEALIVKSSGDADQTTALARFGRIGIFTVEVDRAVLDGRAQVGVHSLKDLTTQLQDGVVLAGVLPRGPVEDVLVGATLASLPEGGRVATGSLRRRAMLLRRRPDLVCVEMRGNVDTRLEKLARGDADALCMARAGLVRLGLEQHIADVLPKQDFVPAVGQGLVGLTCRVDDEKTYALLASFRGDNDWHLAQCERAFLSALRGGCSVPVGGHAVIEGHRLTLDGVVLSVDGTDHVRGQVTGDLADPVRLGHDLAARLVEGGAQDLLEAARAE